MSGNRSSVVLLILGAVLAGAADAAELVPMGSWPQYGGSSHRNNVAIGDGLPIDWDTETGRNIKWSARLGRSTYNTPVIGGGRVFIGTSNAGYVERFPNKVDLGCLVCFDQETGKFLWQYSVEKLERDTDWPGLGMFSAPFVDGDRVWVLNNRCEIVCLDASGFRDGENDGPVKDEAARAAEEADVIWRLDLIKSLGVAPHLVTSSSMTCVDNLLLLGTSNGADVARKKVPAPHAPSFIAVDRDTGKLVWSDASPGKNILGGQWSSPACGVLGGVPQAIFAGGDGWLYSFDFRDIKKGKSNLLWRFDCNPKTARWEVSSRGTRNHLVASPVIYGGRVYIVTGQNPEHGEGPADLWCIDPTKRGDISREFVMNKRDPMKPIPHRRLQACQQDKGDFLVENRNSGVVWHYSGHDRNMDGKREIDERVNRCVATVAIKDDLLIAADYSGIVHCLDAKKGRVRWTYDQWAQSTATPLIVDGKVYVCDEDGDVTVIKLADEFVKLGEATQSNSACGTPVSVGNVLYLAILNRLYAIETKAK